MADTETNTRVEKRGGARPGAGRKRKERVKVPGPGRGGARAGSGRKRGVSSGLAKTALDRRIHEREKYRRERALRFGLTAEQLAERITAQSGRCAVCGDTPTLLHVDHDHGTNSFRGLLCHRCNTGIGLLGDNHERCAAAAAYLLRAVTGPSVEVEPTGRP